MIEEIWKTIEGYPNYEVSNLGNVRSLNFHKEKKIKLKTPTKNKFGYLRILLWKDGKPKLQSIHRLVAKAFIPNPDNLPQVNHKDENKQNNCVDNLEWCTASYNINYGTRTERVKQNRTNKQGKEHHLSKPINQYTENGKFIKMWDNTMDIQREFGFYQSNICACANGKKNSAYGFIWKYAS